MCRGIALCVAWLALWGLGPLCGALLQFFYKHVLDRDWQWVEMIRASKIRSLPDILSVMEIERLIGAARKLRYRVFILTTYSMGLRLGETLALQVGDIDADRHQFHIRRGKGHKDRLVPLPDLTCQALRALWSRHRHPRLLFPNASGSMETVRQASSHMDRGGVQTAMKKMLADCGIKKSLHSHPAPFLRHASARTGSSPAYSPSLLLRHRQPPHLGRLTRSCILTGQASTPPVHSVAKRPSYST